MESDRERRRRESKSFVRLVLLDRNLRNLVGLPVTAVLGIVLFVVGIVESEAWMIVVGVSYAVVSVAALLVIVKPARK